MSESRLIHENSSVLTNKTPMLYHTKIYIVFFLSFFGPCIIRIFTVYKLEKVRDLTNKH